jgi:uncharacterized protein
MPKRYCNLDQFHELARSQPDTTDLVVLARQTPTIRALGGKDSRLIEFRITDPTVDRMYDSVAIEGWDIKWFKRNPVVLWAHSHYDPPVGKAVEIVVDKDAQEVRSIAEFTPREINPLGYMVFEMYRERFLHAVSVGFQPKQYEFVEAAVDAERAQHSGINFLQQELLEYSAVPVPANPNALAVARSAGIDTTPLKQWAERVLDETDPTNARRERLELLRTAASPSGRSLVLDLGDMVGEDDDAPLSVLLDGVPVPLSDDVLHASLRHVIEEEVCRVTGRVSDGFALRTTDEPVVQISEADLNALITQTVHDAISRVTGRVD